MSGNTYTYEGTGLHYLGYVPTSQAYDNLNQTYDRSIIGSVTIAKRSFVWTMVSNDFTAIMNAYRTNYGTGARAFIATSVVMDYEEWVALEVYIASEQVFGSATTKVVDWFELNDAPVEHAIYTYSGSATTENNMFKVESGYIVNMSHLRIYGNNKSRPLYINGGTVTTEYVGFNNGKYSNVYVASGSLTTTDSDFAYGNTANNGGGIYVAGGTVELGSGTVVYSNTTSGEGGGIYMSGGTVTLYGATIGRTNNTLATSSNKSNLATQGGGIRQTGGTLNIQGSTVIGGNYAQGPSGSNGCGGGINSSGGTLTFATSWSGSVKYNACTGYGAGIYSGATTTLQGTGHIQNNKPTSAGYGAGVYLLGGTTITHKIQGSVKIHDNETWYGGGLYIKDSKLTINGTNVEIYSNKASPSDGGGIFAGQGATITFTAGKIRDNTTFSNGGGIYLDTGASLEMNGANALIYGNSASSNGGGVYMHTNSQFRLSNGTIGSDTNPNKLTSSLTSAGGGVCNKDGVFIMTGGVIGSTATTVATNSAYANKARYGGGYASVYNGTTNGSTVISGGTIGHNYAEGKISSLVDAGGGGVYANKNITIEGSAKIQYNYCRTKGGGVSQFNSGTLTINGTSVIIRYNNAGEYGGGVAINNGGKCVFTAGSVNYNTAVQMGGGFALWDDASGHTNANTTLTINGANALIEGNKATGYSDGSNGGGIWINKATVTMSNGWIGQDEAYDVDIDASTYSNFADNAGGGVFLCSAGVFNMSGGYIAGNWANGNKGAGGGGIYCEEGTLNITGGYIDCNGTTQWGGGIRLGHKIYTISNASISYNIAPNAAGISYTWTNGTMWSYTYNSYKWGDYDVDQAEYDQMENDFWDAGMDPEIQDLIEASIDRETVAKLTLSNCTLAGNTAVSSNGAWGDGGAVYMNGGTLALTNGTKIGDTTKTSAATSSKYSNKANFGAGIYLNNYAYMLESTASSNFTIAYNYAISDGAGIYIRDLSYAVLRYGTIQYCACGGSGPSVRTYVTGQVRIYCDMVIKGNSGSYNVLTWRNGAHNYGSSYWSSTNAIQAAICNPYVLQGSGWGTVVSNTWDTYRVNFGIKGSYNGRQNYDVVSGHSIAGYWEEEDQLFWDMSTATNYPADLKNKIKITYTLQYYYRNTWSNSGGYPKTKEFNVNGENNGTQYSCSAGYGDPNKLRIQIQLYIFHDYYNSQFTAFNKTYEYY